jgi:pyrimidine operon attenuation protein/uracil phosphoribosyltransferase
MTSLTLDAEALYREVLRGMQQLLATYDRPPRLVGVASGGVWLAERLRADLGLADEIGTLSSAMHRDDFSQRGLSASGQTVLPFDVNGAHLIVLDDVLYTGRTIRAILNELFDYGRPASVKLVTGSCRYRPTLRLPGWPCRRPSRWHWRAVTMGGSASRCRG